MTALDSLPGAFFTVKPLPLPQEAENFLLIFMEEKTCHAELGSASYTVYCGRS